MLEALGGRGGSASGDILLMEVLPTQGGPPGTGINAPFDLLFQNIEEPACDYFLPGSSSLGLQAGACTSPT